MSAEPDELEVVAGDLVALGSRAAAGEVERQHRVLECGERREELEELEDDPDVGAAPDCELLLAEIVQPAAVDRDDPGGRAVDAGDHVHDRRLAAAGRADDRHHLALLDRQVDAAKRPVLELPGAEDLLDSLEVDQRRAGVEAAPLGDCDRRFHLLPA